jgi:hypothetical protein
MGRFSYLLEGLFTFPTLSYITAEIEVIYLEWVEPS